MTDNILLICDDDILTRIIIDKISLLRNKDKINTCKYDNFKDILQKSNYKIIILQERADLTTKDICIAKEIRPNSEIILLTSNVDSNIYDAYDQGIYDFITPEDNSQAIMLTLINCFKKIASEDALNNYKLLLYNTGIIDSNGYAKIKYLKDNFNTIIEDKKVLNGTLCLLTLDPKIRTKISMTRLANTISKNVRKNDLIYKNNNGLYYIILKETDIEGTKLFVKNLQHHMNEEYKLRAGIIKIGMYNFEDIENLAKSSLQAAITNDTLFCDMTDITYNENGDWLNNEEEHKKYKLFYISYVNKLKSVIEPIFYRFSKEFQNKFKDASIQQYVNIAESVFCIDSKEKHSELIIHFDGFTKLKIQIVHKGLDSSENTNIEFQLNKFTDKELIKILKQLKKEYLSKEE